MHMIYSSQYFSMEAQDAAKEVYEEWEQENLFSKPLIRLITCKCLKLKYRNIYEASN